MRGVALSYPERMADFLWNHNSSPIVDDTFQLSNLTMGDSKPEITQWGTVFSIRKKAECILQVEHRTDCFLLLRYDFL